VVRTAAFFTGSDALDGRRLPVIEPSAATGV
jgi:hypothetical protein